MRFAESKESIEAKSQGKLALIVNRLQDRIGLDALREDSHV